MSDDHARIVYGTIHSIRDRAKQANGRLRKAAVPTPITPDSAGMESSASRSSSPGTSSTGVVGRPTAGSLHWLTVGLALLAMVIFLLTDADGGRSATSLIGQMFFEAAVTIILVLITRRQMAPLSDCEGIGLAPSGSSRNIGNRRRGEEPVPVSSQALSSTPLIMPLLVMVVLASLVWEPVQRWCFLSGRPFEMMVMNIQKNLMLASAIAGCWAGYQRLSMLIGVSIAIFCAAVTREHRVHWLVALYGFAAVSWLVASYWDTLQSRFIAGESRRLPLRWLLVLPSVPLLLLLATATGGQSVITSLRGFLPGSGGDGRSDEFARSGVNDGDALVAGTDNIKSFGPIEDAPFADDDKPSLYDVFNDTFDEPAKKIKDQESSIALPPELMAEIKARMAKSEQAGREFSVQRRATKPDQRRIQDLESHALLYVAGRVPLHLRMEVYDVFDGNHWYPEALSDNPPGMAIVTTHGRPWLRVPCGGRGLEVHVGADTHAIKVINLRSPVIPAPLDLRSIHIDKVDRADMFGWYRNSIIKMTRRTLPELVTIQMKSECMDQSLLPDHPHLTYTGLSSDKRVQLPQTRSMEAIRALAEDWTRGIPGRFQQIEAICHKLRNEYTLDRKAHPPEDCDCPVSHFLLESRRGADYQFATAAVLMLRSLGLSSRVVSGFYADPRRYDSRRRHTAVHSSDVHFWCEVYLGTGTWATLDPSPGYAVLGPPPGFWKRIRLAITDAGRWMMRHWLLMCGVLSLSGVAVYCRHSLVDFADTLLWRLAPAGTPRGRILQTVRLVDRRLRKAGSPRPQGVTLTRWLQQHISPGQNDTTVTQFLTLADWAAFGHSDGPSTPDVHAAETCCRNVSRELKLSQVAARRRAAESQSAVSSVKTPPRTSEFDAPPVNTETAGTQAGSARSFG